jgi:ABC-type Zn uptake system ZnuABC Zn-binding protein ZnuA
MLQHTIETIENKIKNALNIPEENKSEYLELLRELNHEINALQKSQEEKAQSIKGFTKVAAHEITRENIDPGLVRISIEGLSSSVKEFQASHPKLVQTVNAICDFLSKIGI